MRKNKAFTLAEVLITLGIIGVVAAMTIPTLMANYQKQEYVTGLKKAYTSLNQAFAQMAASEGCFGDLACTGFFSDDSTDKSLGDELVKHLKVVKNCGDLNNGGFSGCFTDKAALDYDGSSISDHWEVNYRFITADGMSIRIRNDLGDCRTDSWSNHITNHMTQVCAELWVDVNGLKGPNQWGRDIHYYWVTNGKGPFLYPQNGIDDAISGRPKNGQRITCQSTNKDGRGCAARIMEEGWKMDY